MSESKIRVAQFFSSKYDMKEQFYSKLYFGLERSDITPLEMMVKYKVEAPKKGIDCDVSEKAVRIYKECYEYLVNSEGPSLINGSTCKYQLKASSGMNFVGDTMTSFLTTFKEYLGVYHCIILDDGKNVPIGERKGTGSNANVEHWMIYTEECIDNGTLKISDNMRKFIELNHTIGNQCPVPECFNSNRSNFGKWDFWDLTLLSIYRWYKENEQLNIGKDDTVDTALIKMFEKGKDKFKAIENTKKWLLLHMTWNNFVKANHFQDFVENIGPEEFGEPEFFWEGHSFVDSVPNTKKKVDALLESCSRMIEARGERIEQHFL